MGKLSCISPEKTTWNLDLNDVDSDDHPQIQNYWSQIHTKYATLLLHKIQKLEGFWVKVGQYISTRGDVMPVQYLQILSSLQDSMPCRNWDDTYRTIVEELGPERMKLFTEINPRPLSTASLAQVHKATIKIPTTESTKDGDEHEYEYRDVVIKVQHRGVSQLMKQDMDNLRFILNMLAKTDPDLDFSPIIKEYNLEVIKELDFRIESQNMIDVRNILQQSNICAIVPKPILNFVTEKIIVMDFCEGFPVRDNDKLNSYNVNRELLLERVCAAWAVQMHVGGVFNCDPHLGKFLFLFCLMFTAS